ncbi:MAG: PAS domain-containing protein [Candidatus Omnitrophica bacterium]|nr:PAS domain-containing protein [Candidatus Omnitrophota bacterium]
MDESETLTININDIAGQKKEADALEGFDISGGMKREESPGLKDRAIASRFNGIALSDMDGNIIYADKRFMEMWGYGNLDEVLARPLVDFWVDSENSARVINILRKEGCYEGELEARRKDGTIFHALCSANLIKVENEKPGCLLLSFLDITWGKETEALLKQEKENSEKLLTEISAAYEKLQAMQETLLTRERIATTGFIAAGIAHEIRNPLAIIGMTVQYLQSKLSDNDPKREFTEAIITKVNRLDRVTRELSNYGRTIHLNIARHNLIKCLKLNIALIKPKCRLQRVKIKKEFMELPPVEMDEEQMDKALLNIMDNALQAMPKGGTLTVSAGFGKDTNEVMIKIHNTGSPITKKHLPHIFEPFYTTRKKHGGTGLGLAIVQSVVLRHNGRISVENGSSGKDKGVAFIIRLPAVHK